MRIWRASCPYCKAVISEGDGYGDEIPDIWIPYIRCQICGNLISTNACEFINTPYKERYKIKATLKNCEFIAESLDRTNNKQYLKFLEDHGFNVYPITENDKDLFKNVDFNKYEGALPSKNATESLYNIGILIHEQNIDKTTGSFKKEVLSKNRQSYNTQRKASAWGSLCGLIIGLFSCIALGSANPDGYLFLLGILFGFISKFVISYCIIKYDEYKEKTKDKEKNHKKRSQITKQNTTNIKNEDLASLKQLYDDGIISKEEYKAKAL